jgi:hypothetical protein
MPDYRTGEHSIYLAVCHPIGFLNPNIVDEIVEERPEN